MIRIILSLILLSGYCLHGQGQIQNDSILKNLSIDILNRKAKFNQSDGPLENSLKKFSKEQGLKISYSDNRTEKIVVKSASYNSTCADILSSILKNTGLTYIMIGRTAVIVKEEKAPIQPKESQLQANPHIYKKPRLYSEDPFFARQPENLKREIRKIYAEELKWARNHQKASEQVSVKDTLVETQRKHSIISKSRPYFIGILIAHKKERISVKSLSGYNWMEELQWQKENKNSFYSLIRLGYAKSNFILETGIGFHHSLLEASGSMLKTYTTYEQMGNNGTIKSTQVSYYQPFKSSLSMSVFSIPVEILYRLNYKQAFVAFGPDICLELAKIKQTNKDIYAQYYSTKTSQVFEQTLYKMGISGGLNFEAGYHKEPFYISAGFHARYRFHPIEKNSLYLLKAEQWLLSLGVRYTLPISNLRRITD